MFALPRGRQHERDAGPAVDGGDVAVHLDRGDGGQRLVDLCREPRWEHVVGEHVFDDGERRQALLDLRGLGVGVDQPREVGIQGGRVGRQRPEFGVARDIVADVDAHRVVVAVGQPAVGRFPAGLGARIRPAVRRVRQLPLDHPVHPLAGAHGRLTEGRGGRAVSEQLGREDHGGRRPDRDHNPGRRYRRGGSDGGPRPDGDPPLAVPRGPARQAPGHLDRGGCLLHSQAEPVFEVGAHRCVPSW